MPKKVLRLGKLELEIMRRISIKGQMTSGEIKKEIGLSYYPGRTLKNLIDKKFIYKRLALRKEISQYREINYYLTQKGHNYITRLELGIALMK